jgi:hypothetical protein
LALFDTGSEPSYADLAAQSTLTDSEREECAGGLVYGVEWCETKLKVEGVLTTSLHLDNEVSFDIDLHVVQTAETRDVDHLVGASPKSSFGIAYPVFRFIPGPQYLSTFWDDEPLKSTNIAGFLLVHELNCETDDMTTIPVTSTHNWAIPGSVGIGEGLSADDRITFASTQIFIDTGANLFDIPVTLYNNYVDRMEIIGHPVIYNAPNLPFIVDRSDIETFPVIHITLGSLSNSKTVTLRPQDYLIAGCQLPFRPITDPRIIVGVFILARFAIEFNAEKGTVGLCRL